MAATVLRTVTIIAVAALLTACNGVMNGCAASDAKTSPAIILTTYRTRNSDPLPRHAHPPSDRTSSPRPLSSDQPLAAEPNDPDQENEASTGEPESESDGEEEDDGAEEQDEELATLLGARWHQFGAISAEYLYTGEGFNNARGGISTKGATRYRGNFDLTLTLDTERANWWTAGTFFLYAQHSHGTTLSPQFVGDGQYYSNIDTGPKPQDLTQLGEYWYEHAITEELSIRLGRQDANADFAFADFGADFCNSSFVTLPNIPMPFWPFQTLGVSARYQASEQLRLGGGVYDSGRDLQQWWVTTTSRGMFFIGQADYQPFVEEESTRQTLIRFGAWYTSSDTLAVDGGRTYEGNYGFYLTLDQMLAPEYDDAEQGLGAFLQFSYAPSDRSQVPLGYGGGLVYRGPFAGRDADTLGAAFTLIDFSPELQFLTGQTYENAIEVFYKAQLRDWLAVQPDLQYIVRPSGIYRDALVVGVRFEANF